MVLFVASLAGGLALGGTYILVVLGIILGFRATSTFNFAAGELMLLPSFTAGYLLLHHFALGWALGLSLVISGAVGALFYLLVLRRTTGLPLFMAIIATFGLASFLDGLMGILFEVTGGNYTIPIPALSQHSVRIFGADIGIGSLELTAFTIVLGIVVLLVVRFTQLGMMIRAAGQNSLLASQCGIPVRRIYVWSWVSASLLAAVAGIAFSAGSLANTSLVNLGTDAIPAVLLGGIDSIEGAILGGLLVGVAEGFTTTYLGAQYQDLVIYSLLLVILLIRPQGLFGTKAVVRA